MAFLYHELDTHYELVIPRPAGVSAEVSEDISVDVSQDNEDDEMENLIPSMDFQPGVPSRGKPKKKRKGAPTFNNRTASLAMDRPSPLIGIFTSRKRPSDQVLTEEPQTKRRGRPKGAKNNLLHLSFRSKIQK